MTTERVTVAWAPVRRHLRAVRRSHATRSPRDVLAAVYEWSLYLFVLGGVLVTALRSTTAALATPPAGAGSWLATTALLAGAAAVAAVLRALGPVVVGPASASWLLPAPLDRTGLLAGRAAAAVLATGVVGGGVTGLVAAGAGAASPVAVGVAATVGAVALAAGCVLAQAGGGSRTATTPGHGPRGRRALRRPGVDRIADLGVRAVLVVALLGAVVLVVAARSDVELPAIGVPHPALVAAVLVVPAVLACLAAGRNLGRAGTRALTRGTPLLAALAAGAGNMDTSITAGVLAERRLLRRGTVRSGRLRPGRRRALLRSSLRSAARHGPALGGAAALVVLVHVAGILVPPFLLPVAQLAGATAVAGALASPLRTVAGSAALRRDLGGADRELVALHGVVPFAAAVLFTVLVAPAGGTAVSLVLLPLSAIAVVVRHATRPPRATTMTLYESPVGIAVPVEIVQDVSRGPMLFAVLAGVQVLAGG